MTDRNVPIYDRILLFFFYAFLCVSFLFFVCSTPDFNLMFFYDCSAGSYKTSMRWFWSAVVLLFFYYVQFVVRTLVSSEKKQFLRTLGYLAGKCLACFQTTIYCIMAFSFFSFITGMIMKGDIVLKNKEILEWEYRIFGCYPFEWLHTPANPLNFILSSFSQAVIQSYSILSLLTCITFAVLYHKSKIIFTKYILGFFIGASFCLPFWYAVPVHSPNNYYIAGGFASSEFQPGPSADEYMSRFRRDQKNNPPISCFPSAHIIWSVVMVFYLFRYDRRTVFFSCIWFPLMAVGTVYLAQHYAVDILFGIPAGIFSVILTEYIFDRFLKEKLV